MIIKSGKYGSGKYALLDVIAPETMDYGHFLQVLFAKAPT